MMKNVKALRIGLHQAVFDSVVDHLDEMARARGTTMKIAVFDRALNFVTPRRARNVAGARRQSFENWIKAPNRFLRPADHHAIATLQSPDAPARADVDVIDSFLPQGDGAPGVV